MDQKTFVISDHHLFHKNIIKYDQLKFSSLDQMHEYAISQWNSVVGSNDIVFHLGDLTFSNIEKTKPITSCLNGKKYLILGNHDRNKSYSFFDKLGFKVIANKVLVYKDFILSHEPDLSTHLINYHGHIHTEKIFIDKMHVNVACCNVDFKPFFIDDFHDYSEVSFAM